MALVAMKKFPHLIYFIWKFYKFVLSMQVAENATKSFITVQCKKIHLSALMVILC
jgi:hypothetical protein